jgi:uncharacterized protein YbjT (DUF2867 family)
MNNQRRRMGRSPAPRSRSNPEAAEQEARGMRVLLAGASGTIGSALAAELKRRGYWVRGLTRRSSDVTADVDEIYVGDLLQRDTLDDAMKGVDVVISAAGAPPDFVGQRAGKYSFPAVDDFGNRQLLAAALEAHIHRFAYLSVFGGRFLGMSEYIRAHESFATALKTSGMRGLVVRTTPVFESFDRMLKKAKKGKLRVIGGGGALLNPIHRDDLAVAFVDALEARETEIDVGGPEVLSRWDIADMAIEAWGKEPKVRNLPFALAMYWSKFSIFRGGHNRFVSAVRTASAMTDLVAPETGERVLRDHFAARVAEWSAED